MNNIVTMESDSTNNVILRNALFITVDFFIINIRSSFQESRFSIRIYRFSICKEKGFF